MLKGGRVLGETELFFVYVFEREDSSLKDCFIAPKWHHPDVTSLPPTWGQEFGELYALLRNTYSIQAHNGYWNDGFAAGQRILGHWHVKVDSTPAEGTPAYGKGIALLRSEFNQPLVYLVLDRTGCIDFYKKMREKMRKHITFFIG